MRNNKILILLIINILIQGCAILHKPTDIAGYYSNNWYDTQHELDLHKDYSFVFYLKAGLFADTIRGKWSVVGKQLTLEANYKPSYFSAAECDSCRHFYLEVYDSHTMEKLIAHYNAYFEGIVKDKGYKVSPIELQINIDSIQIESLGYNSLSFRVDEKFNKINVFLSKPKNKILMNKFYIKRKSIKVTNGLIMEKKVG
jgi:hypothetical protein